MRIRTPSCEKEAVRPAWGHQAIGVARNTGRRLREGWLCFGGAAAGIGMENGRRGRACRNCRPAKRSLLTSVGRSAIVAVDWRFRFIALCLQRVPRSGSRPNSVAPPDRFCHAGLRFGSALRTKRGKLGLPRRTIRPDPCSQPDRRRVGLRRGHRLPARQCVLRQRSRLF